MSHEPQQKDLPARRVFARVYWRDELLCTTGGCGEAYRLVETLTALACTPVLEGPVRVAIRQDQLDVAVQTIEQVRDDMELMGLLASQPAAQRLDLMRKALTSARRILMERP